MFKITKEILKIKFKNGKRGKSAPTVAHQPEYFRLQRMPKSSLVTTWHNLNSYNNFKIYAKAKHTPIL